MSMQLTVFEHSKTEKRCSGCKEVKSLSNFCKSKNRKDGLNFYCKQCVKVFSQKNREGIAQRMKVYYQNNKQLIEQRRKIYIENNKKVIAHRMKVYQHNNKEHIANCKKAYINQRLQSDSLFRLIHNLRSRLSIFCKSVGLQKNWKTLDSMGCTREEFIAYFESKFTEGMTWENYGDWHVDHIKPISLATNEQEVKELNHYTNLQPLWAEDNLRKSNKYD